GKRSDSEAVSEVSSTISVGATRNTMATIVKAANTMRSDSASQSTVELGAGKGLAPASDRAEDADDDQHRDHEDYRNGRGERPVVGAARLRIDVQGHVDQPRPADQGLRYEGGDAGRVGEDAAGDHARQRQRNGHAPQGAPLPSPEHAGG